MTGYDTLLQQNDVTHLSMKVYDTKLSSMRGYDTLI